MNSYLEFDNLDWTGEHYVLVGIWHPCPHCLTVNLKCRSMPDAGQKRWYCPSCHSEWNVAELIENYLVDEIKEVYSNGGSDSNQLL